MLSRRSAGAAALTLLIGSPAKAEDAPASAPDASGLVAPIEIGDADFAQAWTLDSTDQTVPVSAVPDIPNGYAATYGSTKFSAASQIDRYFTSRTSSVFNSWFNQKAAKRLEWSRKEIVGDNASTNFSAFWNAYLPRRTTSLMEFLCYMSVFINEVGGNLGYRTEDINLKPGTEHPGIAYLYDRISVKYPTTHRTKRTYNGPYNRTALSLFNDGLFNNSHGMLPLGNDLAGTSDGVWAGDTYPIERFPFLADPTKIGYILETDFFKFRGRGLVQTTWRENYKPIISLVKSYNGTNKRVLEYTRKWASLDADEICTSSRNAEWDDLFDEPERFIMASAVLLHAKQGKYLPLSLSDIELNGTDVGSIIHFGDRIGGDGYGQILKGRVRRLCLLLGLA